MATVTKWKIVEHTQTEEEGVIVSATEVYRVDGLNNTYADRRTLDEALDASGIPILGDKAPGNTNLAVFRRNVRPIESTPTSCEVVIEYKTVADFQNTFIFSGSTSLNQHNTDVDILGNKITLQYTYPNNYPVEELRGQVYTTRANESVYIPRTVLTASGSLYVDYPTQISSDWVWHMNSTFWAGQAPGYWLCTDCSFVPRDLGLGRAHLWQFTWTFELNPLGWPVVAKIIDPNTGNVPDDVVAGTGTKDVLWYPSKDFNVIFGNT